MPERFLMLVRISFTGNLMSWKCFDNSYINTSPSSPPSGWFETNINLPDSGIFSLPMTLNLMSKCFNPAAINSASLRWPHFPRNSFNSF